MGLTYDKDCVVKEVDRRTRYTYGRICPTAYRFLQHKRMGKSRLPERQHYTRNSKYFIKLGDNPLNPLCHLQKARVALVEPSIKHAKQALR
jgi:hypothetical protein